MSNFMANVSEEFDVQAMAEELAANLQAKGYTARAVKMKNGARIAIEKGRGGINTILGMGEGITVAIMKQGNETLVATFSDAEWTSKIIGFVVGFLCLIPFITAIIGTIRQLSLPKSIESELALLVSE